MAMSRKKRPQIWTIFIACEGTNSEPNYFKRIREEVEETNSLAITVYPERDEENPQTVALGLVREAQSRINDFDEVWVVFDKNGYTKHEEAFELAGKVINEKRVNIAFSSISFEHWILLHFEKNDTAYEKSRHIDEQKFKSNETYFPEYHKKADIDIYPKIRNLTGNAIENASWLRFRQRAEISKRPIFEINPYTDVDRLVRRLFGIQTTIVWIMLNEIFTYNNVQIRIISENDNLYAIIFHQRAASLISTQFGFSINFPNIPTSNINPGWEPYIPEEEYRFLLCETSQNPSLVKIVFEQLILFVQI